MPEVSPTRLTVGSGHDQDGTKKEDPSTVSSDCNIAKFVMINNSV